MKNKSLILIIALVVLFSAGVTYLYFSQFKAPVSQNVSGNQTGDGTIVGGDRDEHGCIASAGYSWCELKQECLRSWEEVCGIESKSQNLPQGYTLDNYKITETSTISCTQDLECVTPEKYLVQSSCPYTSLCLNNNCTVVCPGQISTQPETSIEYKNAQYGFNFSLPLGWQGYSIISDNWEGNLIDSPTNQTITGPKILIRHPLWDTPGVRQDIPIMVFTLDQWKLVQQEKLSLGAAPIGPSELGRGDKYVFALPARYNFAFPTGFEEVEQIITSNPLHVLNSESIK